MLPSYQCRSHCLLHHVWKLNELDMYNLVHMMFILWNVMVMLVLDGACTVPQV